MVKIAIINNSGARGGLELFLVRLTKDLQSRYSDLTIDLYFPENTQLRERITHDGLSLKSYKPTSISSLANYKHYRHLVKTNHYNIIITTQTKVMKFFALLKLFTHFKLIHIQQIGTGSFNRKDIIHRLIFAKVSKIITVSNELKLDILKRWSINSQKVQLIYIGTDSEKFVPSHHQRDTFRKQLSLPDSTFVFGVVGRLDPGKGQHQVIEAASRLPQGDWHLVFIGEESPGALGYKNKLLNAIEKFTLKDKVSFLPFQEHPQNVYPLFDLFILATTSIETFGLVVTEAMSCSIPALVPSLGGAREAILNSNGFIYEHNNASDLANKISKAFTLGVKLKSLGNNARTQILTNFNVEQMCLSYKAIIDDLLDNYGD